ncbi:uncharacterized protein K489DRAFT_321249 [Dissoconium aciculare CBS 342.82]|uniref:Uncharacterized protein n=1 Tax=Dissoconium aciculare CBS 342.82 TaxID=1314786 RepID=A0A6J3M169_9PEZI|nr:uncharacterized protein K489DRAFT_321249 [Dissoconium aciculare CBS 342.82]KAF1821766.1 hypothetical protein K489DRAFT_321249 [Dissoconium aciculare CBS 342.82]
MAAYHYPVSQYAPPATSHNSHGHHTRSRRGPRVSSQNAQRQFKAQRSPKEVLEVPTYTDYQRVLEAAKGFEFDDDEVFCPFNLLTEDDLHSIHSASSSEKGSLSSGSPDGSPVQQQAQPTPSLLLPSVPHSYSLAGFQHAQQMKLHQPLAQRTRNAIPIVDPSTRSVASPPMSVSPARQMQQHHHHQYAQRRW